MTFTDDHATTYTFMNEIWVECPQCQRGACNFRVDRTTTELFAARRLACTHCGYSAQWQGHSVASDFNAEHPLDPYFERPLWLHTPCCGERLWAMNEPHIDFLERFVAAKLRQGATDGTYRNQSIASRLPKWIQAANNRDRVLEGLVRLRQRLIEAKA